MKIFACVGAALLAVACSSSSLAQRPDLVPAMPKTMSGRCAAAANLPAPFCCLMKITVGVDGTTKDVVARCTDPALEPKIAACQSGNLYEPAKLSGVPITSAFQMRMLLAGGGQRADTQLCEPLKQSFDTLTWE